MCGIAGVISNHQDLPQLIRQMNHQIEHRGPDEEGIWIGEGIALGHRRLSILDLTPSGHQPMSYGNERYWIVFNGEIYNFIEIKRELEQKGYQFKSASDTEVVLAAYLEWGNQCLIKFNGMWAFAIWDRVTKTMFVARDRFGVKPLFFYLDHGIFAFASEMKGLFPVLPQIKTNVNTVRTFQRYAHSYEGTTECLIEGIRRFPAGYYGIWQNGQLGVKRWWNTLDHLPTIASTYDDQVEQFREIFLDSCRIRMRSDVPIGTCLSGGLDSSAVTCGLSHIAGMTAGDRQSSNWQNAFVMTFPGSPIDEKVFAERIVEHTSIQAHYLTLDPMEMFDNLDDYLYKFEELHMGIPFMAMQTYAHVRKAGVVVTLDGHGGDEILGGYPWYVFNALEDFDFDEQKNLDLMHAYYYSYEGIMDQIGGPVKLMDDFLRRRMSSLRDRQNGVMKEIVNIDHPAWKNMDFFSKSLYWDTHRVILPTLLRNYDRCSMAHGVEIRMPLMDWRLITYAFALPWHSKLRDGYTRKIFRDAAAPFTPQDIAYRRSKIGFNVPMTEWFRGQLRPWIMDVVASQDFLQSSLVDGKRIAALTPGLLNKPEALLSDGEFLWNSIMPYLWEKAINKGYQNSRFAGKES